LGPTPADLEMPGSRKFTSTRLQMEMQARKETDKKLEEVTSRLDKLQEMMAQLIEQQMSSQKSNSTPNGCGNALQRVIASILSVLMCPCFTAESIKIFYFGLEFKEWANSC
jgi:hypothetical protein